ncbi:MAG: anthranilate synthase component I family protein, partial [Planctomycetota bacterium]
RGLPDLDFGFYHTLCVFDHAKKTLTVISLADTRDVADESSAIAARQAAIQRIEHTTQRLEEPAPWTSSTAIPDESDTAQMDTNVTSNFTRETFGAAVEKCVDYIRDGDIFQVVPSQRFEVPRDGIDPLEIYRTLRTVNPSPFMFLLRTPQCTLIGCSPEIMCRVNEGRVTVRPLAGTRRRGKDDAEDRALEQDLLSDPKERAEHIMLVDLGRNDVGRVAEYGSVELTEVMVVERYSHVMHISSEVCGQLKPDLDAFDALKAALPAGTVSGAPKVRAMEVIDELEPHRRGPYGGAVGYIDYRGNMETCIALRTMVVTDDKIYVQAGCGVVADSNPDSEYEETVNKATAMIAAIGLTRRRLAK